MAKKKVKEAETPKIDLKDLAKQFLDESKKNNKELTEYASVLSSSIYSNIDEYIDTGSYALNRLITGDIYKGIPRGRVVALAGQSGVGKSFVCGMAIKKAQEMGYLVVLYDSENAIDNDFMKNIGVDTDAILHIPINIIEEFRNHVVATCKKVLDDNEGAKIMVILDSYGNLSCAKEKKDMDAGKENSDMGCFVADTDINVNGEVKKIRDVVSGDVVVSHLNRKRKVTKVFKYSDKSKKMKIQFDGGAEVVTPQHKFLVFCPKEKKLVWKEAKNITIDDKMVKMMDKKCS